MRPSSHRGFALLVTIVLLGFLILLLVSLCALTRVETQVASNCLQTAQARQHALLGLNIALGQLQKHAGPDQRVTASADLNAGAANPRYTGAWNVAAVNAAALANSPLSAATTTALPAAAAPDVWLVSGNDFANPRAVAHDTASGAADFETIVGGNTTGAGDVRVKKVDVTSSNIPGFSSPLPIGRYAYWVGDEGVKAKLNLTDPYTPRPAVDAQTPAVTPTAVQSQYRLTLAHRAGVEQVLADTGAPLGASYAPTANTPASATLIRNLQRVLSYAGSAFTGGLNQNTLKARYYDLTTHSAGLLTDTAQGGLKYDLTWDLTQPRDYANATGLNLLEASMFMGKCIVEGDATLTDYWPWGSYSDVDSSKSNMLNPRWSVLRDFYQLPEHFNADGSLTAAREISRYNVNDNTAANNAVTPVFVQMRVYMGAETTPTGINARTYVMILVANPYNVPLSVPGGLRFGRYEVPQGKLVMTVKRGSQTFGGAFEIMKQFNRGFSCTDDLLFAPGEVKILTMPADSSDTTIPVKLKEGVRSNSAFCTPIPVDAATAALPSGDWNIAVKITADGQGWFQLWMLDASGNTLQDLKYISYRVPTGSGVFTGAGDQPIKIGGLFLTLKMPGEPGYPDNASIRLFTDYNIRSQFLGRFKDDWPIAFQSYYNQNPTTYSSNLAPPSWGLATSDPLGRSTGETILFDVPRRPAGTPASQPVIVSLGQLQHANISNNAYQPAHAIGNSYASLYCQPERSISFSRPVKFSSNDRRCPSWLYDMSYLLNETLWDRYYFSSVPQTSGAYNPATDTLPNSRYIPHPSAESPAPLTQAALMANAGAAAKNLRVNGAFNVNSTSVEAWKAVFTSMRGLNYGTETNLSGPFFRTLSQPGGSAHASEGLADDSWTGFRNLSSAEIDTLATKMVEQVHLRGPFRSMADFVNRRLMTAATDPNGLRLRGALQAAIDSAGINDAFDSTGTITKGNDTSSAWVGNTTFTSANPNYQWMIPENAVGNRATGAPGWLTQADLLQALGPTLAPRSDTFVIRAYGEGVNPATNETTGRAWCEAVVQRTIDYVDPSAATGNLAADAGAALKPVNAAFGRRFKIVSFRWLSPNDL